MARLIVGLEGPRAVEGLGEFLAGIAAGERAEGDLEHLDYLEVLGNPKRLSLRRGYTHKQLRDAVERGEARRLPAPRPAGVSDAEHQANPTPVAGRNLMEDWIAPRSNRLCRVADLAAKVAKKTGCSEAEATMFLLCDQTPELPWLEAQVFEFDSARRRAFIIAVGSPLVPAEDLRRFYVQVREQATLPGSGGRPTAGHQPLDLRAAGLRRGATPVLDLLEDHLRGVERAQPRARLQEPARHAAQLLPSARQTGDAERLHLLSPSVSAAEPEVRGRLRKRRTAPL